MATAEVYLHGFMAGPALWRPVHEQLNRLTTKQPRAAIALPYHGPGPTRPAASSFAELCRGMWRQVDAEVAQAQERPVHLVGYSLGARVALVMAGLAPHRVASLTLIGAHPGLTTQEARALRRQQDSLWAARLRALPLCDVLQSWDAQPLFAPRADLPAHARAALAQARRALVGPALALALEALGLAEMPDTAPTWQHLTMPVQLAVGGRDQKFMALAQQMARAMPFATLTAIDGGHHDVVLSHPREVAEVCLTAFGHGS